MGSKILDQYTLLHFATGIIAYFWDLSLLQWFILHLIFEIIENTSYGIYFINHYLFFWPGGKPGPDTYNNSLIGDNIGAVMGWLLAYYIDNLGKKYGWYSVHIKK